MKVTFTDVNSVEHTAELETMQLDHATEELEKTYGEGILITNVEF